MLSLAIAGIGLAILAFVVIWIANNVECDLIKSLCMGIIVASTLVDLLLIISVLAFAYRWQAADAKAAIVNRKYDTNYTQTEIFYASDLIDIIHDINKCQSKK
jgi:hypothetical protein